MRNRGQLVSLLCNMYNPPGIGYGIGAGYGNVLAELSGEGLGSGIGDEEIAAELGIASLSPDELMTPGLAQEVGARAASLVSRGAPAAQVQRVVSQTMQAARARGRGFQLLSNDPASAQGAFGIAGSMCLLSFSATILAGATTAIAAVTLDRKSTIRELRADALSAACRITNFTAAALPFAGLQFPFSLASFGPNVQDRKIRALTFEANSRFQVTVNNPTGADIPVLVEGWGTPG
jgi:hypothetical protein